MVMGSVKIAYETYGHGSSQPFVTPIHPERHKVLWMLPKLIHRINLKSIFLPKGFPHSVSQDYLEYQVWDTVQAVTSSITGALAGQAVLIGFGVGDARATILGASLSSMLKDGFGMVGKILFAAWQGANLDGDCKRWRLFADLFNDCALLLELISPLFPRLFVATVCIASVLKSIVGVAGGATRAAVTLHQALDNNVADVAAKDGSQETMSNFVALMFNLLLIYSLSGKTVLIYLAFATLTALHLYANYRAVRCLRLSTFNRNRFHIATHEWFQRRLLSFQSYGASTDSFPSVLWVNAREPIFTSAGTSNIRFGCSLRDITEDGLALLPQLIETFAGRNYLIYCPQWNSLHIGDPNNLDIFVVLLNSCQQRDQLKAMLHAELLVFIVKLDQSSATAGGDLVRIKQSKSAIEFLRGTLEVADTLTSELTECVMQSPSPRWELDFAHFCAEDWRYTWTV